MTMRAKMQLENVFPYQWGGTKAIFRAIYDPSIDEDKRFMKATPTAMAEFQIDNPEAASQLVIGGYYYFDISPVEKDDAQ